MHMKTMFSAVAAVFAVSRLLVAELGAQTDSGGGNAVPRPLVEVGLQVVTTSSGSVANARVVFPDGYWHLDAPGVPRREGSMISIHATAVKIETLVPPSGPAVFEPRYPLGVLPAGAYTITYHVNDLVAGVFPFTVGPSPTLPQLSFINFRQGDVSVAAEVGVAVPVGTVVTDWGEVMRDGSLFKVALGFGPSDPPASGANTAVLLERQTYSLGVVEPGVYQMAVRDAADGRLLGTRGFTVGPLPPPPPPPPPVPVVAYIEPGLANSGWFVEVGLALLRPGLEIKDWGTPVREGNRFRVMIQFGPVAVTTTSYDPVSGGFPVFYCPPPPADQPPSVVDSSVSDAFREINGWPVKLVRHRYELGFPEPGEYGFVVNLGGQDVAKRAFTVPQPGTPGPVATLDAPPVLVATAEPQQFRILFNAAAGWNGDPGQAPVTVNGPSGFSGTAVLVSSIPSLDPLGRFFSCTYSLTAPGGSWDAADTGEYRVCVDLAGVVDRNGRTLPNPCIGSFPVKIRPDIPPPLPSRQVELAVEMRDGFWFANVSFENTGEWFAADWGGLRVHGDVFAAFATLRLLPPGSLAPIPAAFTHRYPLGSPPPGRYAFVFKSSAGHCAAATFVVPGTEPTSPALAWAINTGTRIEAGLDDDRDGWSNLAEFYLCMKPNAVDQPAFRQKIVTRDGKQHSAFEFVRLHGAALTVSVGVEVSRDLITWVDAGNLVDWVPAAPDPDGTQAVEVIQKPAIGSQDWPFMRMKVEPVPVP